MPLLISTTRKSLPKKGLNQTFRRRRRDFRARPWGNQPTHPFSLQPKKSFLFFLQASSVHSWSCWPPFSREGSYCVNTASSPIRIYPSVGGGAQSELKFGRRKGTKKIRGRDKAKFVMQTAPPLPSFFGRRPSFYFSGSLSSPPLSPPSPFFAKFATLSLSFAPSTF